MGFGMKDNEGDTPGRRLGPEVLKALEEAFGASPPTLGGPPDGDEALDCCQHHLLLWLADRLEGGEGLAPSQRQRVVGRLRQMARRLEEESHGTAPQSATAGVRATEDGAVLTNGQGDSLTLDPQEVVTFAARVFGWIAPSATLVAYFKHVARQEAKRVRDKHDGGHAFWEGD
jgi:hypothetical protein